MKRLAAMVLVGGLILSGCQDIQVNEDSSQTTKQEPSENGFSALPTEDVIESTTSGEIKNMSRFQTFLEHANEKEPDHIQIVQFTTEGDPISRDLQFDGTEFKSVLNSSRDRYGSGGISEAVCSDITTTETTERTDYLLEGCENTEEIDLLIVWK
ncbi:DUF4362 domain-containing protein [Planococcus halotolerans]|uniref:DUF4362 domain-containing protein n=1 Tax=Planococcus halotolerans TaxID=2233542 RepID=A0A365L844_9BACL|nr:DUF4362 domain-containing protein [Planococcus halotolerans]RAZ81291.1 hypothetical protein DP120_03125 [Planococcus halotolerans]